MSQEKTIKFELPYENSLRTLYKTVKLKPYDMKICACDLELKACEIEFSDIEIFAKLQNKKEEVIFLIADKNAHLHIKNHGIISGDKKDYDNISFHKEDKTTQFVFLTKDLADKTWLLGDKIIFNADYVLPNGAIAVEKNTEIAYFDLKYKFSKKNWISFNSFLVIVNKII